MLIPFPIYLILIDSFPSFCHSSVVKVHAFKVHSPISASGLYRQNDRCYDSIPTSALLAVPQDCIDFWLSLFIDLPIGEVASLIAGFILQPVSSFVKGRSLLFWPFFSGRGAVWLVTRNRAGGDYTLIACSVNSYPQELSFFFAA